jgi:hypothetical protein
LLNLDKITEALEKIGLLFTKVDKLFKLGVYLAKLANAHRDILKKQYPDTLPPDLDIDFEKILEDDVEPETKPDPSPP